MKTKFRLEAGKMFVRYRSETYDLTEFMKKHPGGSNTLNGMLHADIDYKFDTGMPHSSAAKYLMREYKVSKIKNDDGGDDTCQLYDSDTGAMQLNNSNTNNNNNNNNNQKNNNQFGKFVAHSNDDIYVYTDESMEVCKY